MVVGRLLSHWEGNFSGAMLNFRGVISFHFGMASLRCHRPTRWSSEDPLNTKMWCLFRSWWSTGEVEAVRKQRERTPGPKHSNWDGFFNETFFKSLVKCKKKAWANWKTCHIYTHTHTHTHTYIYIYARMDNIRMIFTFIGARQIIHMKYPSKTRWRARCIHVPSAFCIRACLCFHVFPIIPQPSNSSISSSAKGSSSWSSETKQAVGDPVIYCVFICVPCSSGRV